MEKLRRMFKEVSAELIFDGVFSVETTEKDGKKTEICTLNNLVVRLNAEVAKKE